MNIRDFFNFIEDNAIDLDFKLSVFVYDHDMNVILLNDVDYILQDGFSNRLVFTSKLIG